MKNLSDRLHHAMRLTNPPTRAVDLARSLGVSKSIVSNWLSGKTVTMSSANLAKAATALDVSGSWLGDGLGPLKMVKASDNPNPYNDTSAHLDAMRKATRFAIEYIGLTAMEKRGPDWTADTIIKLYEFFKDPNSHQITPESIIKLIK